MTQQMGQTPEAQENGQLPDDIIRAEDSTVQNDHDSGPEYAESQSTTQVIRMLVMQGQEYAATEMQRQKLRVRILGLAVRDAIILGLVAIFLLMGLLIALLIGGIWALAPHVGPIWALVIVMGGCFALIILLLLFIRARIMSALNQTFQKEKR